jgi:hypothetical protein
MIDSETQEPKFVKRQFTLYGEKVLLKSPGEATFVITVNCPKNKPLDAATNSMIMAKSGGMLQYLYHEGFIPETMVMNVQIMTQHKNEE